MVTKVLKDAVPSVKAMGVVQYIVVRQDLAEKYGAGTLVTQISHASLAPITNQLRSLEKRLDDETGKWVEGSFTKIILASSKEKLVELMRELDNSGVQYSKIEESTLGGELTCIGLKPYEKQKVAALFKDLKLFGKNGVYAFVDGEAVEPSVFTYNMLEIDRKTPDMNHRFSLQIDFDDFMKRFGSSYDKWRDMLRDGTGDEYIDKLGIPSLDHLKKNDEKYNKFLLDSQYQPILNSVLPKTNSTEFVITSLEGIFYKPNTLFIHGGCSKE